MASYFDAQPPSKATAEVTKLPYGDVDNGFGRDGLLTPQVTRILDDLDEHSSSSESEPESETEGSPDGDRGRENKKKSSKETGKSTAKGSAVQEPLRKTPSSSTSSEKSQKSEKGGAHPVPRLRNHPRLDRFVSLRSTLLSAHVADKLQAEQESKTGTEKGEKKTSPTRDMTDGSPQDLETGTRKGFARRMSNKLRKITSKDVPTMHKINEDAQHSASHSDTEHSAVPSGDASQSQARHHKKRDSGHADSDDDNDDSIRQSEIEDLVRWVNARKQKPQGDEQPDTSVPGPEERKHGSLKPEDVDELVKFVAQKRQGTAQAEEKKKQAPEHDDDLSDASTESDEDDESNELEDGDVNELVQWVSRSKDPTGGIGGPVKPTKKDTEKAKSPTQTTTKNASKAPEVKSSPLRNSTVLTQDARTSLDQESVATEDDTASNIGNEDVKLIRTVTRDECTKDEELMREAAILKWRLEREEQQKTGTVDEKHRKSLTEEDIDELVKHVNKTLHLGEAST